MVLSKSKTNASAYLYINRKLTLIEKLKRAKEKAWELKKQASAQKVK